MSTHGSSNELQQIYRIDKFIVPGAARQEFVDRVNKTNEYLRTLPGFIQDKVLEQTGGPGEFNFITIVIWKNAEAIEAARKAVTAMYEEIGFDPQDLLDRLGIKADLANYQQLDS